MIDMTENDFGVLMRPIMEEDGDWDGNVQISVFSNLMPKVNDEVHSQLMFLAYKMSAMVQYCNDNPDFDDTLNDYTEDLVDEHDLDPHEDRGGKDLVNHPIHYKAEGMSTIECIEAIQAALTEEEFQGFCKGNNIKYTWRANRKHDVRTNLEKARWYLNKLLESL